MTASPPPPVGLPPEAAAFYRQILRRLSASEVPFLLGGAYAFASYTGISRHTKDLDVLLRPQDLDRALAVLADVECRTSTPFPHWLAKAHRGEHSVDLIFRSGNGVSEVDDSWFAAATEAEVLDVPVLLCPPEEIIWTKAYIMERERYDGADVLHLLLRCAGELDWERLLERFGPHWRLLLSHLILFSFAYPSECERLPPGIMQKLLRRLQDEAPEEDEERLCRGTLLSRAQYLVDVGRWGYRDARLHPHGSMTGKEVENWTAAIEDEDRPR